MNESTERKWRCGAQSHKEKKPKRRDEQANKQASKRASERKNKMLPLVLFLPTPVPASTRKSRGAVAIIVASYLIYSSRVRSFTPSLQSAQQYNNNRLASRILFYPTQRQFCVHARTHPEILTTQTLRHTDTKAPSFHACIFTRASLSQPPSRTLSSIETTLQTTHRKGNGAHPSHTHKPIRPLPAPSSTDPSQCKAIQSFCWTINCPLCARPRNEQNRQWTAGVSILPPPPTLPKNKGPQRPSIPLAPNHPPKRTTNAPP